MPPIIKQGMKLVDTETGSTINTGAERIDFRGEEWIITGGEPPKHSGSTGRVLCTPKHYSGPFAHDSTHSYYPSVFNLKWVSK